MAKKTSVGIDIGTHHIKVAVAQSVSEQDRFLPRLVGFGGAESKGLRHGYIINQTEAAQSLRRALGQAEKSSGTKIRRVFLSIGGVGLSSISTVGSTTVSKADQEITDLDIQKATKHSEELIPKQHILNRKIVHSIPVQYRIDGKPVWGRPLGLKGNKLEVKTLFITCLEHHINDLISLTEEAGLEIEDIIAAPLAASIVTLTKLQKMAGCVLVNIGAETVSIVVFENNIPISLEVFPIGSNDITNDIALGLKVPIEEAEEIKLGRISDANFSKRRLDEIIEARLADIFELIEAHLKKIGRNGLLPAGIILTGGGAVLPNLEEYARAALKLPSKRSQYNLLSVVKAPVRDTNVSVSYGLCVLGLNLADEEQSVPWKIANSTKRSLSQWIKQFLP